MSTSFFFSRRISVAGLVAAVAASGAGGALLVAAIQNDPAGGRGRAGGGGMSGLAIVMALDTDGQEGLSAAEIDRAPQVLRGFDRNGDGRVTGDELPAFGRGARGARDVGGERGGVGGPGRGERGGGPGGAGDVSADELTDTLMAFDANKDGKLTRAEVPERLQGLFDRADADKDGALTADEIRKSAQATASSGGGARDGEGRQGRGGRDGGRFGGRGPGAGNDALFAALDRNNDGALSLDEISGVAAVLRRFDANRDGVVTMEELGFAGRGGRGRG